MVDLIDARIRAGSRPRQRVSTDKAVLALVVEGGGMRGVVSAGMVTALHELGIRNAFDLVVGTSAGALAGAFYLAGQPALGTSLYYQDLISPEWLHYRRALRRKPIVGLDFLIDTLMTGPKGLDADAVIHSDVPLHAVATRVRDYQPVILENFASPEDLRNALRASARIPLASGAPVAIGDEAYIDGSVAQSIPIDAALDELEATHVLALLTRPKGELRGRPTLAQRRLVFPLMNRVQRGLGDAFAERSTRYAEEVGRLDALAGGGGAPSLPHMRSPSSRMRVVTSVNSNAIPRSSSRAPPLARRRRTGC